MNLKKYCEEMEKITEFEFCYCDTSQYRAFAKKHCESFIYRSDCVLLVWGKDSKLVTAKYFESMAAQYGGLA